jgi:hypothetical protein
MWSLTHQLFKLVGTHVLQGGMSTGPMVKSFYLVEGGAPGLGSRLKCFTIDAFNFETVKETLCDSIIVTIGSAAHAHPHAILLDEGNRAF